MRPARRAVAVATAATLSTVVACSSSAGLSHNGPLREVTDGSMAGTAYTGHVKTPYETDMRDLCTSTGKPVHITKVSPWKPVGGIRIVDWGVRVDPRNAPPAGPSEGGQPIKVSQVGGFTTGPVTVQCGSTKADQRFYVSVSTASKKAWMHGATIYYGHNQVMNTQMTIVLCTTGTLDQCEPPSDG